MPTLKNVKKVYLFWGKHPAFYALVTFLTFLGREKFLRQRTAQKLRLYPGDSVLDLACGTGRNFPFLERIVKVEGKIIGFDYSDKMLEAANDLVLRNKWHNVELMQGDAAELEIRQKSIDGVISVLGLSAVPDFATAIQKTYDILKKGRALVVCDAKLFNGFWAFLNPLIKLIYKRGAAWDYNKSIPEEMKKIFGNVEVETFLGGAFYIAKSIK